MKHIETYKIFEAKTPKNLEAYVAFLNDAHGKLGEWFAVNDRLVDLIIGEYKCTIELYGRYDKAVSKLIDILSNSSAVAIGI